MGNIGEKAAGLAVIEWRDRWNRGAGDEDDPHYKTFVAEYWDALGPAYNNWENTENPWSAAFISFVFKMAGASPSQFPFSAGHHTYIRRGDRNFMDNNLNADLIAYTVDERRPEVGDLVVFWREAKQRLRHLPAGGFKSHMNVIVSKSQNEIVTIGGNLGDSVRQRRHHLDSDGHIVLEDDMMGFLKVNF